MHGNQWVLKIAVLKYYSVSKRGTTAKSNPKQATDPISLHTKFGDNSSNTFPLNERKPCVTPDIGRRTPDIGHRTSDNGHRTSDGEKSKNNISTPQGGGHNNFLYSQPTIPKIIALIFSKPGSKWYYNHMVNQSCNLALKGKWSDDLKLNLNANTWDQIFTICFKIVTNNSLVWFQYKILHRILGTQKLLHQMGKSESDLCLSCHMTTETLMHLFCWCSKVEKIWQDLKEWIKEKTGVTIHFNS